MPRGDNWKTEQEAIAIVRAEEIARGWTPGLPLSKTQERKEGCDFLSTPPGAGLPHPVEVKGWGESLFDAAGVLRGEQDINVEQYTRAQSDPNWRLEIVANLTSARNGTGQVERLTLTAADLNGNVRPAKYWVKLSAFANRARLLPPG